MASSDGKVKRVHGRLRMPTFFSSTGKSDESNTSKKICLALRGAEGGVVECQEENGSKVT